MFMTHYVVYDFKVQITPLRLRSFGIVDFVSEPRLVSFLQGQIASGRDDPDFLIFVRMRGRKPYPQVFTRRDLFHGEAVMKGEMTRCLGRCRCFKCDEE